MLGMRVKITFEHINICQPRKRNRNKETSPNMGVNMRSQTRESSPYCNLCTSWCLGWAPGKELKELMSLRSETWNCCSHNTVLGSMVCFFLVLAWSWWFPGVPAGLDPHMQIQRWMPSPKTRQESIAKSGGKEKPHFPRFLYVHQNSIEFVVRNCHLGGLWLQCPLILGGWGEW